LHKLCVLGVDAVHLAFAVTAGNAEGDFVLLPFTLGVQA
jgi:hypothetical protein